MAILKYSFTLVGLVLLLATFFIFKNTLFLVKNGITAEGVVMDLIRSRSDDSDTFRPVVEYTTRDGSIIVFTSSSGSNPPSFTKGEAVEVFYQESFPERAKINHFFSLWGSSIICGSLGAIFFVVGFSMIVKGIFNAKKIEYLVKSGIPIKAKFQSVEINGSLEVNGRNPYRICAQWVNPATSKIHVFMSDNIWFDPTGHIDTEELTVLIEKDNPGKYHVDTSFLPELAS